MQAKQATGQYKRYLLDVVEGVLGDVGHPRVGVLPHDALLGLHLAGQQLDQRRLARAVGLQQAKPSMLESKLAAHEHPH